MENEEKFRIFNQTGLFLSTAVAIGFLSQGFMIGNVVGLFAQGFWFYTSLKYKQWGVFALSIFYTVMYFIGAIRWGFEI